MRKVVNYTLDHITKAHITKPPIKLIGAKTKVRSYLYPYFPEHKTYVEPFMGTAGVLIGKPICETELIGDKEWEAINFYLTLQEKPEEFWDKYQKTKLIMLDAKDLVQERAFFQSCKDILNTPNIPNLDLAVAYYFVNKLALNGIFRRNKSGKVNSSYCKTIKGRGFMDRAWFDLVLERIKDVKFNHGDYRITLGVGALISPKPSEVFTFADPPYRNCKTTYNGVSFTDEDHVELKNRLVAAGFKWMLTINDDQWVRDLYKDFNIFPWKVNYSCSQTNSGRGKKPELIITNYDPGVLR